MHLEGAECIDTDFEALDAWHAAGLRSLGPVWSRPNRFGHGVPFRFPSSPDTGAGLTDAGRALVAPVQRLQDRGRRPPPQRARVPGRRRRSPTRRWSPRTAAPTRWRRRSRNLTDEQLDEVGKSGGIVGIPYIVDFLRADGAWTATRR